MLLWVVAAGCWTIVAGGVASDGGGGGGGVAFAAAAQGVLGGRPPRQRATATGSRGLQAGMGKKNRRARLFKDTPEREPTEASRRLREASKRRPRSTGTASDQEPRQTALGRRNVGTVAGNHASGLLRITRADIEGSLACSDKNLARFCKQVSFADCGLAFLDRTGGGEHTRTHTRARARTHTHTHSSLNCIGGGQAGIDMDISVQRITGSEFFLKADVSGSLECECDRCLASFEQGFDASFSLVLAAHKQLVGHARRRADEPDDQVSLLALVGALTSRASPNY